MHRYWHVTIATASGGEIQAFDSSPTPAIKKGRIARPF
jgi:hypothetical protein